MYILQKGKTRMKCKYKSYSQRGTIKSFRIIKFAAMVKNE